jgi:LuxR family maltose regulon positive regulatory protein
VKIAPAQVWLAEATATGSGRALDEAEGALTEHRRTAEALGLQWLGTKLDLLTARVLAARGDGERALATLDNALVRGERQGYVRLFTDEGPPLVPLLARIRAARARHGNQGVAYLDRLLLPIAPKNAPNPERQVLVEPLTAREIEVLKLIAAGHANPDIARAMFVAPSTVKSHVNRIFRKLGVTSRVQALARGRDLGLI